MCPSACCGVTDPIDSPHFQTGPILESQRMEMREFQRRAEMSPSKTVNTKTRVQVGGSEHGPDGSQASRHGLFGYLVV